MTDYKIGQVVPMPPKQPTRTMRDVIANGEDWRSRNYAAVKIDRKDGPRVAASVTSQMFISLGRERISCPECGAEPGQPCTSTAKRTKGGQLPGLHPKRFKMAQWQFGKKDV